MAERAIWKFALHPFDETVRMPDGAVLLTAAAQGDDVCVWALVDPSARLVERAVRAVPTGAIVPSSGRYVGTALLAAGRFVFHVFDFSPPPGGEET